MSIMLMLLYFYTCIFVIFILVSESVMVCLRESKCVEEKERERKSKAFAALCYIVE